jgi:hypothetical protein
MSGWDLDRPRTQPRERELAEIAFDRLERSGGRCDGCQRRQNGKEKNEAAQGAQSTSPL